MNLAQALQTFFVESRELLDEMEAALLSVGQENEPGETVNAIFRAAHTIKGSAGLFGLDPVVAFTHVVESVLDEVREGRIDLNEALIALLLACDDHIRGLVDAVEVDPLNADPALIARGEPLLVQLRAYLAPVGAQVAVAVDEGFQRVPAEPGSADLWHISLRFGPDVLRNGMDPLSFLRYLNTLGSVTGIVTLPDAIPPAAEMDPESCYLGFEIALRSQASKAAIESVFDFVLDDCTLHIVPPNSRIEEYISVLNALPEDFSRLGEMLVRCGTVTAHELETALRRQADAQTAATAVPVAAAPLLGAVLMQQGSVSPPVVEAALEKQKRARDAKVQESQSVRVDADKLDHLINLVGELIIASASANLLARKARNVELQEANSVLSTLVEEVRDSALQLRMVKIGATFSRFQRVVHDVSRELGKDIALVVSGEDTELDKTVVEKIGDPLTHLVRNAMDHGIDSPELRAQRGKPARGTVKLNAFHDSGSIVIEVSDDGGGLDREKILAKAIERGLIEPGRVLSDAETYSLVFEPGFSTAEKITNLSGRGVGMDVVKRNIAALRGSVGISSEPGLGTTVSVRLPLTLAIINGFQIGVGRAVFVVPLDVVDECVEFTAEAGHDYTDLRGQVLPFIRLHQLFDLDGPRSARPNIVVVRHAGQKFGLLVDTLLGEAQTVIKPLSKMFAQVQGISGSSILGSGDVALILDVPALAQRAADPSRALSSGAAAPAISQFARS